MVTPSSLPEVFTRADADAAGLTRNQVETRLRSGAWIRLRRGAFCRRETFESTPPDRRHLLHATATRLAHPVLTLVESHVTAAARWSLPMPLGSSPRAYLTDGCRQHSTRLDDNAVIEVATLWPGDCVELAGVPLTSPGRTVADCLRHYPAEIAVPIADAALKAERTWSTQVARILELQAGWPYAGRANSSWPLVDGRRESWLESTSAVRLWSAGVELAEPQVEIFDRAGTLVGRVDNLWSSHGTVGEADGAAKYSLGDWPDLAVTPAEDLAEAHIEAARRVVRDEKNREDSLRSLGLEVVRWGTAEIMRNLPGVVRRVRAAQARGNPARFTGQMRSQPRP